MSKTYISYKKDVLNEISKGEERALEAIGIFIDGETQARCPVKSGDLKNSYTHKVNIKEKSVTNGTPVEYAPWVEKGNSRQTAQPHLYPAIEENLDRIKKLAKEMMDIG